MKHFLSITEISVNTLAQLVQNGINIIDGNWQDFQPLKRKIVGIYFRKPSTRTRTSFTAAAIHLGATPIFYGANDLQVITGESLSDTGKTLACYLNFLVMRTNQSVKEMRDMADQKDMAVINAMSKTEHPTQVIGDLITIKEAFGRLKDIHILYLGEGNNTAAALALAVSKTPGMRLSLVTPKGYGLADDILETVTRLAIQNNSNIEHHHSIDKLPKNVDVVYTTRWETMGEPHTEINWEAKFEPYRITSTLMREVSKSQDTIFLHDLPAMRNCEVVDKVIDGSQSLVFRQAHHKLTAAMSILTWCADLSI